MTRLFWITFSKNTKYMKLPFCKNKKLDSVFFSGDNINIDSKTKILSLTTCINLIRKIEFYEKKLAFIGSKQLTLKNRKFARTYCFNGFF